MYPHEFASRVQIAWLYAAKGKCHPCRVIRQLMCVAGTADADHLSASGAMQLPRLDVPGGTSPKRCCEWLCLGHAFSAQPSVPERHMLLPLARIQPEASWRGGAVGAIPPPMRILAVGVTPSM